MHVEGGSGPPTVWTCVAAADPPPCRVRRLLTAMLRCHELRCLSITAGGAQNAPGSTLTRPAGDRPSEGPRSDYGAF